MKKLHINWQNGMKISKNHFLGMENAMRDELLDHLLPQLTTYNYGLCKVTGASSSCDLYFKLDQSDQSVLNLVSCYAITPGGIMVSVESEQQHLHDFRIKKEIVEERLAESTEDALYVVLHIDVFNRTPFGDNLSGEDPPRQPYSLPLIYLDVTTLPKVSHRREEGVSQLIIGRIIKNEKGLELDKDYIPPCTSIISSKKLAEIFGEWERILKGQLFNNLKNTIRQIEQVRSISKKEEAKDGLGEYISITNSSLKCTRALLAQLAQIIPDLPLLKEQPFIYTFNIFKKLALVLKTELLMMSTGNQAMLLNYLKEALEIEQLEPKLDALIETVYEHDRIDKAVNSCQGFFTLINRIYDADKGLPVQNFDWKHRVGEITINETKDKEDTILG